MLKIVLRNTLRKNPFQDSGAFLGEVKEIKNFRARCLCENYRFQFFRPVALEALYIFYCSKRWVPVDFWILALIWTSLLLALGAQKTCLKWGYFSKSNCKKCLSCKLQGEGLEEAVTSLYFVSPYTV